MEKQNYILFKQGMYQLEKYATYDAGYSSIIEAAFQSYIYLAGPGVIWDNPQVMIKPNLLDTTFNFDDMKNNLEEYVTLYNKWYQIIYNNVLPFGDGWVYGSPDELQGSLSPRLYNYDKILNYNLPCPYGLMEIPNNGGSSGSSDSSSNNGGSNTINDKVLEVLDKQGNINKYTDDGRLS